MSHAYDKTANCQCERCTKERARRVGQAVNSQLGVGFIPARAVRAARKAASREEQHARYIDCGPGAWDDRE